MPTPELPDFEHALQLGQGLVDAAELAEAHGLLCGLLCRDACGDAGDFLGQLSAMRLVVEPAAGLRSALADAWRSTIAQLDDDEFGFALWLPGDDDPLEDRTVALARWCAGFLAGLGSGGQIEALSDEAREAIGDLQEIARAELSAAAGERDESDDREEDEQAFAEIVEYVRVVALTMREEFRGPARDEPIH